MNVLKMKIDDVITNIYNEVKRRCELPSNAYGIGAWDHHIKVVYELAKNTLMIMVLA